MTTCFVSYDVVCLWIYDIFEHMVDVSFDAYDSPQALCETVSQHFRTQMK